LRTGPVLELQPHDGAYPATWPAAEFVQLFAARQPGEVGLALGARERQRTNVAPAAGERVAFEIFAYRCSPMCQRLAVPHRRSQHQARHFAARSAAESGGSLRRSCSTRRCRSNRDQAARQSDVPELKPLEVCASSTVLSLSPRRHLSATSRHLPRPHCLTGFVIFQCNPQVVMMAPRFRNCLAGANYLLRHVVAPVSPRSNQRADVWRN